MRALGGPLLGHVGQPPAPHDLWSAWNLDPLVLVPLVLAGWAFARGAVARGRRLERWRVWATAGALAAVVVAVVSPLEALSSALASAHMVQHVLLVLVAAPLVALAGPGSTVVRGAPLVVRRPVGRWRRRLALGRVGRVLAGRPVALWLAHVGVLWAWHARVPYEAALRSEVLHGVEHLTFVATGVLFWQVVVGRPAWRRVPAGPGVLLVFAMALQSVFLSALLTFSPDPWYGAYADTTGAWGLSPLADQQLAGLIMWVPAGVVYLAAGLGLLVAWIRSSELGPTPLAAVPGAAPGAGRGPSRRS